MSDVGEESMTDLDNNYVWASDEETDAQFNARIDAEWEKWALPDYAWQVYEVFSEDVHGKVRVLVSTNDDDDDGIPDGKVEQWSMEFPSVEAALEHCGRSRVGISGVRVTVLLDGSEQK
jgi:hypothetical protein